jgi:hypothetical protein
VSYPAARSSTTWNPDRATIHRRHIVANIPETDSATEIPLAEMIETLRQELEVAQIRGVARPVAFGVEKVELELKMAITRKARGEGGIRFWVLSAGASAEGGRESVHTFKLTLSPLDAETKKRLEIASVSDAPVDLNR